MAKKHTGKIGKHHHSGVHGGSMGGAHASHGHMNKAHGTPGGFDAPEEYGGHEHDKGLSHPSSHGQSMTGEYHGMDGEGKPGGMDGNECCE
jgi:hypothetical protein